MATTYDDAKKHILYENKEENLHKLQFCPQFPSMFIKNGIQNRIFLQKNLVNSHFMFIFASTEPATPLNNAHQGGAFLYIDYPFLLWDFLPTGNQNRYGIRHTLSYNKTYVIAQQIIHATCANKACGIIFILSAYNLA